MVKNIRISDFDYQLPDGRIARHPLAQRDACKLLVSQAPGEVRHEVFSSLPELLPPDSMLVCNDTRVINARIIFEKATGSKIEVFLLEPLAPEDYVLMFQTREQCRWSCMVGNLKRWKDARLTKQLDIEGRRVTLTAEYIEPFEGAAHSIEFSWDDPEVTFASIVDAAGYIPIPPYLKRDSEAADTTDYQTVFARYKGSVAAPTAGLHFTPGLMERLRGHGIDVQSVTLHVGAGTFQPVKSEQIGDHPMHTETFSVTRKLVEHLLHAVSNGVPITAVGTTTVRTLESLPYLGQHLMALDDSMHVSQWEAYDDNETGVPDDMRAGETCACLEALLNEMDRLGSDSLTASTSIMIAPGFRWRIVDRMVTNFHQPQSTLLLLVSSFLGNDSNGQPRWRSVYGEALANGYRFLSYGDACFFKREE